MTKKKTPQLIYDANKNGSNLSVKDLKLSNYISEEILKEGSVGFFIISNNEVSLISNPGISDEQRRIILDMASSSGHVHSNPVHRHGYVRYVSPNKVIIEQQSPSLLDAKFKEIFSTQVSREDYQFLQNTNTNAEIKYSLSEGLYGEVKDIIF